MIVIELSKKFNLYDTIDDPILEEANRRLRKTQNITYNEIIIQMKFFRYWNNKNDEFGNFCTEQKSQELVMFLEETGSKNVVLDTSGVLLGFSIV